MSGKARLAAEIEKPLLKQNWKPAFSTSLALRASKQAGPWWTPGESRILRSAFAGEEEEEEEEVKEHATPNDDLDFDNSETEPDSNRKREERVTLLVPTAETFIAHCTFITNLISIL